MRASERVFALPKRFPAEARINEDPSRVVLVFWWVLGPRSSLMRASRNARKLLVIGDRAPPGLWVEQIQRKTRVRDKTPQNAPRTRPDVKKVDQKAELKKNQTALCRKNLDFFPDDRQTGQPTGTAAPVPR